jgi:hypothetical protein
MADWAPYEGRSAAEWMCHGTATLEGITGALAWRKVWIGIAEADGAGRELST